MNSYGRLSTAFYDLDKPAAPPDAIAYYRNCAALSNGSVLEPMCGSGRFLIPLLQAGVPVEGVDASREMLAACRVRADSLRLVPTLYEQSLQHLSLPHRYSLAFVPSGSLGLIQPRDSLRACLRGLLRHFGPNAILLVELVDPEAFEAGSNDGGSRSVETGGGGSICYTWRSTCNRNNGTVNYESRYQLREADTILADESEQLVLSMYAASEFLHELRLAGFSNARVMPTTDETGWLRESGCSLYECTVPGGSADA